MLLTETVEVKLRKNLLEYYYNLGYNIDNNIINIKTKDLHKGSSILVDVECDNCHNIRKIEYKNYYKIIIKYEDCLFYCKKCKYCRIKKTNLQRHGVENVMQIKEIKNKSHKTIIERHGKLGINDYCKIDKTINEKYGNKNNYNNIINNKKIITNLQRYGVENVMQVKEIRNKNERTFYENYGEFNPMKIKSIVDKATKNQIITKLNRNIIIPNNKLSDFEMYKKIIIRLIYKYKRELFNKWNGYDYYDNEYIKNNLTLKHTDSNYPTIDHKISVFYGFNNNIIPHIIGDINNLCITKRKNNSYKHINNELKNNHK